MSTIESQDKKLVKFINQCINTFISLIKVIVLSKPSARFPQTKMENCAILGNGPSLNVSLQKYFAFFKQHELKCVNNFSITDQYQEV